MEKTFIKKLKGQYWRACLILIAAWLLTLSTSAQTPSSRQVARPKGSTSCYFGYYEYLPSNYSTESKHPVVIFLHGIGEAGNGTSDLSKVLRNGPSAMVSKNNKDFPFILISPQHNDGWWNTLGIDLMISHIKKTYKVDTDRIYVTGLSAGGYGTWVAGQGFASQLAGIVPICGCGDSKEAAKMKNLAVWAFHNSGDPTVQTSCSTKMTDEIKKAGGNPKLTIYQSNSHDAWTATYNDQNMWNWLLAQRKGTAASPTTPQNQLPSANAGSNISITLPTSSTSVSGSGSDSDGSISTYTWTKQSGPAATLSNASTATLSLSGLVEGSYVFRLTVKDNQNATAFDEVTVTVNAAASVQNNLPVLSSISNQTIVAGTTSSVNLSATDSDNDPLSLSVSGLPSFASFTNNNNGTGSISFAPSATTTGTTNITVTVSDGKGGTNTKTFSVIVSAPASVVSTTPTVIYRVNCGGVEVSDSPIKWGADTHSSPSPYLLSASNSNTEGSCWWPNRTNTTGVSNCIFGSFRSSSHANGLKYAFQVNNGSFKVNLFFSQKDNSFWAGTQKAGDHVFNIYAEGTIAAENFDIYVENGYNAVKKTINVSVTDGILNLDFSDVKGYPSVNGIEVIQLSESNSTARVESVEKFAEFGEVLMYPNPLADDNRVTVEFEQAQSGKMQIEVINQMGATSFSRNEFLERPTMKMALDLSDAKLNQGLYYLRIKNGFKKAKTLKVIKK